MKKIFLAFGVCACVLFSGNTNVTAAQVDDTSRIVVCSELFKALGKVGGGSSEAGAILSGALADKEFFIRAYASRGLGLLGDRSYAPALKKMRGDDNYFVMVNATLALVRLGSYEEEEMFNLLKDKRSEVRRSFLEELNTFGDQHPDIVFKMLRDEKNEFVREQELLRFGETRFAQARRYIVASLEDDSPEVRQAACFAIGQLGGSDAIGLLSKRLGDKEPRVRAAAKEALGVLGDRSIMGLLWQDLKDNNVFLRGSSYVALANLKQFAVLPLALKEIVNPAGNSYVRTKAADALAILRPQIYELSAKAIASLNIGTLSPDNLEIGFEYKIDGRPLTDVLIAALNDAGQPLHKDAPSVIAALQLKSCLPVLRQALLSDDPDMAAAAAHALGEMKDNAAAESLIQACKKYGCGKV